MHSMIHHTDSKDPDIHVIDGWMPATKTHPACTFYENGMWLTLWLDYKKKTVTYANISPKNGDPADIAGNAVEEEAEEDETGVGSSAIQPVNAMASWGRGVMVSWGHGVVGVMGSSVVQPVDAMAYWGRGVMVSWGHGVVCGTAHLPSTNMECDYLHDWI